MLNVVSKACVCCRVKRSHKHSVTSSVQFVTCPDPRRVESYLKSTIDFSDTIQDGDQVCFQCYRFFNQKLKSSECMLSNEDVVLALKAKKVQFETITSEFQYVTSEPYVQLCLYKTALSTCELLVTDRAFLFPNVYRQFMEYLADGNIDLVEVCVSKSRLLTFLGNEFGELLTSFCSNKRVGTVFHRTKADMQVLLSNSLYDNSSCAPISQDCDTSFLNTKVHEVIKHQKSLSHDHSVKLAFDVDKFVTMVQSIAPELWEHVCKLTQSVNERKGRCASVKETSFAGHIKHLRRTYLVSLILFITSSECNFPFHVVLSDMIEGSTELITVLNRFGIVASVETLKRTILSVSQDRKAAGVKSLLVDKAFTVASADNVDFLQSNAAVYAGNQHRSWHATSIQLVQPMPETAVHSAQGIPRRRLFTSVGEVSTSESTEGSSLRGMSQPSLESNPGKQLRSVLSRKRQERSSPMSSPTQSTRSPHSKRPRTFAEATKLRSRNVSDLQAELIRRPHVSVANERPVRHFK